MKNKHILAVDDVASNLDIIVDFLDGFDVIDTTDGYNALEIAQNEKLDLILLDIVMPEIDGFEVCKRLKSNPNTKDIPIIFITSKSDEESIEKAYALGGVDYVTKPFRKQELLARVTTHISHKELLDKQIQNAQELELIVKEEVLKNEAHQRQIFVQSRLAQMGEMISMIAHQWRQPLGAISATSANLKLKLELEVFQFQSDSESEGAREYFIDKLADIEKFVQSLTQTIDDFRNFYKPNRESQKVNIDVPFEKALAIVQASFELTGIKVIKKHKSEAIVEVYENEIMQVILNILKNAQDNFIEKKIENPEIHLWCEDKDKKLVIHISDNGGGIPSGIMEKIFDPYFSTKSNKNGTGLGLYMSKMIIEEHHHGTLSVSNRNDGACFKIELGG